MNSEGMPGGAPSLDFSKLIGSVLSNPAALSTLTSVLGGMMQNRGGNESPPPQDHASSPSPEEPAVSAFSMPSEGSPLSAFFQPEEDAPAFASHRPPPDSHASHVPQFKECAPPPPPHSSCRKADERRRLLMALKPFLSRQRCEALDYILRISELFGAIGIGKGGNR